MKETKNNRSFLNEEAEAFANAVENPLDQVTVEYLAKHRGEFIAVVSGVGPVGHSKDYSALCEEVYAYYPHSKLRILSNGGLPQIDPKPITAAVRIK